MPRDPNTWYEKPDPNPMQIPAGFRRPPTLAEQVARLVRSERFMQEARDAGFETFEEAEDFDIDDDPVDPSTPYEPFFDPALGREVTPADILDERKRAHMSSETEKRTEARKRAKEAKAAPPATPPAAPPAAGPQEPEKSGS